MPGTILLADLERANDDELRQHLGGLLNPPPAPVSSDSLTNPLGTGNAAVSVEPPPELQEHLATLLAPPPPEPAPTPVAPTPTPVAPEPTPAAPSNVMDELASHVQQASGGALQLMGQGMTALNSGAQAVGQGGQNVISLVRPPEPTPAPPAPTAAAPPSSDSLTNPLGPGNAAPPTGDMPSVQVDASSPEAFIRSITPAARWVEQKTGLPAAAMIGMAANETGYGKFAAGNNLFGIKGSGPAGSTNAGTWEDYGQGPVQIRDNFRAYNSPAQSFMDFADLIQTSPRYAKALGQQSVEGFVGALKAGGYMTDPAYVGKIRNIVDRYAPIIGGAVADIAQGAGQAVSGAVNAARGTLNQVSQFGDSQLTASEAAAACGPAAAVRFAQRYGRNPSLREATDLAASVGWTQGQGMAGIGSEKALLDKMGVATKLVSGPDWGTFANEARSGNPVIISTAGHYFTADNWDPATNRFHVGRSGLDLRGGSEWMTPEEMTSRMGAVQGGLLADNPTTPASTLTTSQGFTAPGGTTDQQMAQVETPQPLQIIGQAAEGVGQKANEVVAGGLRFLDSAVEQARTGGPLPAAAMPTPSDTLTNPTVRPAPPEGVPAGPATVLPALEGPAVLPALDQAQQALRNGNPQAALDALGQAREAVATSAVGPALGMLRGPELLSDEEIIQRAKPYELDAARRVLEQSNAAYAERNKSTPEPVTDEDLARYLRNVQTGFAAGGIETGPGGAPRDIPGLPRPTPRLPTEAAPAASDAAEVARLRLDKFPEELRPAIEDAARETDFGVANRRGVIPDAQAEAMADQVGRSVDDWIATSKVGQLYNTEESRALRNLVTSQAAKVNDLSQQVTAAAGRGEVTDRLIAETAIEGEKLQGLIAVMEGNRAEWGRAGRAWSAKTRLVDMSPNEAINEIYGKVGGRENALTAVQEYQKLVESGANPATLADFWAKVQNPPPGVEDWFRALRYNSMLTSPRTAEINIAGNLAEVPWRFGRDTIASLGRGRPEELGPEARGLLTGLKRGWGAARDVLRTGISSEQAAAGDLPRTLASRARNPLERTAARVIEAPGRVLQASDEVARAMAYSMAQGRRAAVEASKEGLTGSAWQARVDELLANPTGDMAKEALAIADRMTYKGDMGTFGRALEEIQKVPYIGNVLLPFLRTVYHISARGVDRSPAGLVGTGIDVASGKYGPRNLSNLRDQLGSSVGPSKGVAPLGERLGDNLMGSAAFAGFLKAASEGQVTGAGPDDREKRDMLRAQGWQPYSLKLGDKYVSYSNWGPLAIPLAGAAAAAEAELYPKPGASFADKAIDGFKRTAQLATEQSYLQGIGTIWKALDDPERYGSQVLGQFATSLVPFGAGLNTLGQALDPLQRQPERQDLATYLEQSVEARLPGLRENVPAAQDQLGRPISSEQTGLGALNPLRTRTVERNAALQTLLQYGADVGEPVASFKGMPLTPAEQREINRASGTLIEKYVRETTNDPQWTNWGPDDRRAALQKTVEAARREAAGVLVDRLGTKEFERRLAEERTKKVPGGISGP